MAAVFPFGCIYASTSPSPTSRASFLAASCFPRCCKSSRALSRLPLASSNTFLHSEIEIPLSSLNCFTSSMGDIEFLNFTQDVSNRTLGVVVCGDNVINQTGINIGIHEGNNWDPLILCLFQHKLVLVEIADKYRIG